MPKSIVLAVLAGLLALAACSLPGVDNGPDSAPAVVITSPRPGGAVVEGEEVLIESVATDAAGVTQIELLVDGQLVRIDASPESGGQSPYVVAQPWTAQGPGEHTIAVRAVNIEGGAAESAPLIITVGAGPQAAGEQPAGASGATPTTTPTVAVVFATVTPTVARPTATVEPTPTSSPTPLPTEPPPATVAPPTSTPTAPPTEPPPATVAPSETPTPAATFVDTGLRPEDPFLEIWDELGAGGGRLGFPTGPAIPDRNYAKQYFEGGFMYWWDRPEQPDTIWVFAAPDETLAAGQVWARFDDTWNGGDPYSCDQAREHNFGPVAGFGWVWCQQAEVQQALGRPIEPEAGSSGNPPFSRVQFFQGGAMLDNPANREVWVLFAGGGWQRRSY
ncbi:MAG: Ig-like domain-containing protein [Anaerolineae bacterium]